MSWWYFYHTTQNNVNFCTFYINTIYIQSSHHNIYITSVTNTKYKHTITSQTSHHTPQNVDKYINITTTTQHTTTNRNWMITFNDIMWNWSTSTDKTLNKKQGTLSYVLTENMRTHRVSISTDCNILGVRHNYSPRISIGTPPLEIHSFLI